MYLQNFILKRNIDVLAKLHINNNTHIDVLAKLHIKKNTHTKTSY